MRFKNSKWTQVFVVLLLSFGVAVAGAEETAGQQGNGGGGVERDGRYMTFYSAGFYAEKNELLESDIDQLNWLIGFLSATTAMTPNTKGKYISALIPTSARKYYRVKANTFTTEVRNRLVAEYLRVVEVAKDDKVAIFAITDKSSKTTYLLPEFFGLTNTEKAAILFHESFWLAHPQAGYPEVISAETAFQAYIENLDSAERMLNWVEASGDLVDVMQAAIAHDLRVGAMSGLLQAKIFVKESDKGRRGRKVVAGTSAASYLNLFDLLGAEFFACKKIATQGGACNGLVVTNLYALSGAYSQSLFLKLLSELSASDRIDVRVGGSCSHEWSWFDSPWYKSQYADDQIGFSADLSKKIYDEASLEFVFNIPERNLCNVNFKLLEQAKRRWR